MITKEMIRDVKWYCGRDNIGIVLIESESGEFKAYIGTCGGCDEEGDKLHIAQNGSKFHQWQCLWPHLATLSAHEGKK